MEPHRMVEAHHAGRVAVEMQWPAADAGPIARETEQGGVQVYVVGKPARDAEPHAMGRITRAVRSGLGRTDPRAVPRAGPLVDREFLRRRHVTETAEVVDVAVAVCG